MGYPQSVRIVRLSEPEATQLLHLLRTIHMAVGSARDAVPPDKRDEIALFSLAMMGQLHQAVNGLEGSIYEAQEEPHAPSDPFLSPN